MANFESANIFMLSVAMDARIVPQTTLILLFSNRHAEETSLES